MKTKSEIESKVLMIFNDQFEDEKLDWNKKWTDYNFSSIQLVYFLKDLEGVFGPIPIAEFYDLQSVNELVSYLMKRNT